MTEFGGIIDLNTRFQLAVLCFYGILLFSYRRGRPLKQRAAMCYTVMLMLAGVYLLLDIATVCSAHLAPETVLNDLLHRCYIATLAAFMFMLALYVEALGRRTYRHPRRYLALLALPYVLSIGVVVLGSLSFERNAAGVYTRGAVQLAVQGEVLVYALVVLVNSFRYRDVIPMYKRHALRAGVGVWMLALALRALNPSIRHSGLAVVLELFVIYLSFENPSYYYEELTETFNNKAFDAVADEHLSHSGNFCVLLITVTDYSAVQKSLGTNAMPSLIQRISQYLSQTLGTACYSMHANLVLALLRDVPSQAVLKRINARLAQPWLVGHNRIRIFASVCVLRCPEYAATLADIYALVGQAAADPQYNSRPLFYVDHAMVNSLKRAEAILELLRDAVLNDGLEVHYQPIYSVKEQRFATAEALVRLRNTQALGRVSPEEFIPIAERNGLITALGEVVCHKVCRFASEANLPGQGVRCIEINLSAVQAVDANLPNQLSGVIQKYHIKPEFLNFEITETSAVQSGAMLADNMRTLREMGVTFSMDDFGTGYSNLSQMADTAFDIVKLDKSLVWPCFGEERNVKAECILGNVAAMLRTLGIATVAEGIETREMAEHLSALNVDYLQGYYFARPMPEQNYLQFLQQQG